MKLEELKTILETGTAPHELIIFIRDPDNFLVKQYIQAICDANNLLKSNVNSLIEEDSAIGLVLDYTDTLKVLDVDVFDEVLDDYSELTDTIVVCNKIDKKIRSKVEEYIIEMPKLLKWQIIEYMKLLAPALSEDDIEWLYVASQGDIYKIINELDKITSFAPTEQKTALEALKYEEGTDLIAVKARVPNNPKYRRNKDELVNLTAFRVVDAILDGDKETLLQLLTHKKALDIDFMSIVNNLLPKAKQILLAVYQHNYITASEIGCSDKQFNFFTSEYSRYSQSYLQYLIGFLSEIDLKLKTGLLDISKEMKLDYLITHLIA